MDMNDVNRIVEKHLPTNFQHNSSLFLNDAEITIITPTGEIVEDDIDTKKEDFERKVIELINKAKRLTQLNVSILTNRNRRRRNVRRP